MKMLRPKKNVVFKYIYYAMKQIKYIPSQHQRHWISKYSNFTIPMPSFEVQEKIVEILNAYTESFENSIEISKLQRKKYEYYRNQLLTFD